MPLPRRSLLAATAAASLLVACGSDDAAPPPPSNAQLRAIHASADTPAVDVFVNGSRALAGVTFGQASGFNTVPAGTTRVQVSPAGQPASAAAIDAAAGRAHR
jgi:hypothetical protein